MTLPDVFALTGLLLGTLGASLTIAWLILETWGDA